ncbi:hypothetical protein PoB_007544600 [Plakobranchus ocellatus]|uniref:Uncharacterized protein n=1 Tax=Plakobranchus ocellatus TaxID=259542 RepID=A0AAV4DYN7_9GAST|nr:hypothetical protein PoB_007544600 [Plakobranchus ocellatus]
MNDDNNKIMLITQITPQTRIGTGRAPHQTHLKDPTLGHHLEVAEFIFGAELLEVTYDAVAVSIRLHTLHFSHILLGKPFHGHCKEGITQEFLDMFGLVFLHGLPTRR